MTDVNHRMSKALMQKYGSNTLFVIEELGETYVPGVIESSFGTPKAN